MKKVLSLVAVAGLIAISTAAFGKSIVGGKHDLAANTAYVQGTSTQICIYCHAPHNALISLPLWNRNNPDETKFELYSGLNMANVSFKTGFTADSTSLFCMSCHDGQTDMSAIHNAGRIEGETVSNGVWTDTNGSFTTGLISNSANLTTDLSKTHPINFPVSLNDTQSDLNVGANAYMGPGYIGLNSLVKTFPLFKSTGNSNRTTADRSLECGSCHAVHNDEYTPFLRDTMDQSKLCLGCHNK